MVGLGLVLGLLAGLGLVAGLMAGLELLAGHWAGVGLLAGLGLMLELLGCGLRLGLILNGVCIIRFYDHYDLASKPAQKPHDLG